MVPPAEQEIVSAFESASALTVGLEEELMLIDPGSGGLTTAGREILADLEPDAGEASYKLELPAAHLEIVTAPKPTVGEAIESLRRGRHRVAEAAAGRARPCAAGVHPTAPGSGALNTGPRYDRTAGEFGKLAGRQLVCALQVHVACGGAERSLAVHNALRCHLPDLAALAANAPFYEGVDTGLASIRPKICELLPRQGVPPEIDSWEAHAESLRWAERSGSLPDSGSWWWELRPHLRFGTLELRVPDAQTTVAEAAGVAAFAHCLVASLCERFDAGDRLPAAASWRIAENRWRAARDGVEAELADLETGEVLPARERLSSMIEGFAAIGSRLGCEKGLELALALVRENGAMRQRAAAAELGMDALPGWLAERWLD